MIDTIEAEEVAIGAVRPHPANPRIGDVAAIKESLLWHGQYRTIVVQRSTGYVLAGNHTWRAAKELGWATIKVGYIDCDAVTATRILLVDNRDGDLARYDDVQLLNVLNELAVTPEQLMGTGWSIETLTDLANRTSVVDLDELEERFGEPDDAALWPTFRVQLPPERFSQLRGMLDATGGTDDTRCMIALLDQLDPP